MKQAIAILLLLCVACFGTSSNAPEANVHSGSNGLVMTLQPSAAKVFAGDSFNVVGTIENQGATNVDNGMLSIGLEDDFIAMDGSRIQQLRLAGRSAFNTIGESKAIRLDLQAKELPSVTETVTSNILLTMCYPYQTLASATICIDPDLENKKTNKACTMGTVSLSGGQGAPVAVATIEPSMGSSTDNNKVVPMFTVTVNNIGGGQVVAPEHVADACQGRPVDKSNYATVRVFLTDKELTCATNGAAQVTFQSGHNQVRCKLPDGIDRAQSAYNSVIRVQVDYGYTTTMTRSVDIARGR